MIQHQPIKDHRWEPRCKSAETLKSPLCTHIIITPSSHHYYYTTTTITTATTTCTSPTKRETWAWSMKHKTQNTEHTITHTTRPNGRAALLFPLDTKQWLSVLSAPGSSGWVTFCSRSNAPHIICNGRVNSPLPPRWLSSTPLPPNGEQFTYSHHNGWVDSALPPQRLSERASHSRPKGRVNSHPDGQMAVLLSIDATLNTKHTEQKTKNTKLWMQSRKCETRNTCTKQRWAYCLLPPSGWVILCSHYV